MEAFFDKWFVALFFSIFIPFFLGGLIYHFRKNCVFNLLPDEYKSQHEKEFYLKLPEIKNTCVLGKENTSLIFLGNGRARTLRVAIIDENLHIGIPLSANVKLYRMTNLSIPIADLTFEPRVKWFGVFHHGANQFGFRAGPLCLSLGSEIYKQLNSTVEQDTGILVQ